MAEEAALAEVAEEAALAEEAVEVALAEEAVVVLAVSAIQVEVPVHFKSRQSGSRSSGFGRSSKSSSWSYK